MLEHISTSPKLSFISFLFWFVPRPIVLLCVPPECCWKSKLGRVGGVECHWCVSFVFIVLTGAQWYDCVAIWNSTPTQSFRGSEVGEMCVPLVGLTMRFERPRNQSKPTSIPSKTVVLAHIPDLLVPVKCSCSKYKWRPPPPSFRPFPLLLCNLSHYFKVPFEEWPAS